MSDLYDYSEQLCEAFELDPSSIPPGAHVALEIEEMGTLHLEAGEEKLILYLARPLSTADDRHIVYRTALEAVHYHNGLAYPVQVGLHGDKLVFLARVSQLDLDLSGLEQAVRLLCELQDEVRP